jgi:hypothetical protein
MRNARPAWLKVGGCDVGHQVHPEVDVMDHVARKMNDPMSADGVRLMDWLR